MQHIPNVRNRLTATRWQVTLQLTLAQTNKPHYVNTLKLFGHGCGPWKAPSHQMDHMYLSALEDDAHLPKLSEIDTEISTLGQALT